MAWNKNLPADNSVLRLSPDYIRQNWDAIETADTTLKQTGINFAVQGSDLAALASAYRLFSKNDTNGDSQLFGVSSDGTVKQFTGSTPSTGSGTGTSYSWDFENGLQLRFGNVTVAAASTTITFNSAFSTAAYCCFLQRQSLIGSALSVSSLTTSNFSLNQSTTASLSYYYLAIGS